VRFLVGDKAAKTTEKVSEAANIVADTIKTVTKSDVKTPEDVAKIQKQLAEDPELRNKLQVELSRVDLELERIELEREQAYLEDTQDARIKAIERRKAGGGDTRANVMLISAFVAVIGIVALLILAPAVPPEVKGFVIGIGGMFARNIGSAFDFEFGSSRGSKMKEAKFESHIADLQQATRERIADKEREVEGVTKLAKQQIDAVQTVRKVAAIASKANQLRKVLKSS
jgi:hypothetical protein